MPCGVRQGAWAPKDSEEGWQPSLAKLNQTKEFQVEGTAWTKAQRCGGAYSAGCKARRGSWRGAGGISRDGGPGSRASCAFRPMSTGPSNTKRGREAKKERREATQKRGSSPWTPETGNVPPHSHTRLRSVFITCQDHSLPRTFALTVSPAWSTLPSDPRTAGSFCECIVSPFNVTSSRTPSLTSTSNHASLCPISLCHCLQSIYHLKRAYYGFMSLSFVICLEC